MNTTRLILVALFSVAASLPFGQAAPKYAYCNVHAGTVSMDNSVTIVVDFGYRKEVIWETSLKDISGERRVFKSIIDALNFMAKQGWELVQVYTTETAEPNYRRYLMKKPFDELSDEAKQELMKN